MKTHLKILILEDSPDDVDLIERQLQKGGVMFTRVVVKTKIEFENALKQFSPDVIIADHSLPHFNSIEPLQSLQEYQQVSGILIPFILVTGTVSEEFAVKCIRAGAHDYILKDRLTRLCPSIENALEKCKIETESIISQRIMKEAEQLANFGSWQVDMVSGKHTWSDDMYNIYGYEGVARPELSFERFFAHVHPDDSACLKESFQQALKDQDCYEADFRIIDNRGNVKYISSKQQIIRDPGGQPVRVVGFNLDITERKKAHEALKEAYEERANILESIGDAFFTVDKAWTVTYWNRVAERHLNMPREKILGRNLWDVFPDAVPLASYRQYHKAITENVTVHFEEYYPSLNLWFDVEAHPALSGLFVYFRNITRQKKYIRKIEDQNIRLKEIAWIQSHEVRAPLARMMGLIDLINNYQDEKMDLSAVLNTLAVNARELDDLIKRTVRKTEAIAPSV